ncbi:MAG: tetratricopeptide repeat protein, partial [Planctomycetota bacterium]
ELQSLGTYFGSHYWRDTYESSELYRPVTKLSFALTYHGVSKRLPPSLEALPHHLLNLLLHLWAVWLVWRMTLLFAGSPVAALCAALVFGVHALHSEVVASISGRAELLAFCLGAAALLCFRQEIGGRAPIWRLALVPLLLSLAFGSKENALGWAVFLPLAVLVDPARSWRRLALCLVLVALPLLVWLLLRQWALAPLPDPPPATFAANPLHASPAPTRVLTAVTVWGFALGRTLFPIRLASDYGPQVFSLVETPWDLGFLLSAACLGGVLVLGLSAWRRHPLLFLATTSFFGFSFIVSNVLIPIGTIFAERLYYLPSLGFSFLVAWLVKVAVARSRGAVAFIPLLLWSGHCAVNAFSRSFLWKDTATLALHDVEVHPRSAQLRLLAAGALKERGDLDGAILHLEESVRASPRNPIAHIDLAALYLVRGDLDRAEQTCREGLAHTRDFMAAERASLHTNLGLVLGRTGRFEEAIREHRIALALAPGSVLKRHQLLSIAQGRIDEAELDRLIADGEKILPGDPVWAYHRGLEAARLGRHDLAREELERVVRERPSFSGGQLALARTLFALGRKERAAEICRSILRRAEASPEARRQARDLLRELTKD